VKSFFVTVCVLVLAVFVAGAGLAQDNQKAGEKKAASPSPEEMAAWQKAATPGPHHAHFKDLAGAWNAECKYWMQPGTDPQVEKMKTEYKLVFGGRYLTSTLEGTMMGMPFSGMGIAGYDNVKGVHTMVWLDNMSTTLFYSEGTCSDNCSVETHHMTQMDPMTGSEVKVKTVTRFVDNDKHVFEYFMVNPDGSEFKSMEIVYTRM